MIGREFGSYRIIRELARGGMGTVYEGEHRLIGERVAIKVLKRSSTVDPNLLTRVLNEARAVHLVSGDGVVKTRDAGMLPDGTTYIVMERLSGESLAERLQREGGKLPLHLALRITQQIAETMTAVHAKGLTHRDLKPDNIFLLSSSERQESMRIKVLDFGLVKLHGPAMGISGGNRLTAPGEILGTVRYMAPEQLVGSTEVDTKVDVYSLGIVTYQMLAGRIPFDESDKMVLALSHADEPPPPVSRFAAHVPVKLVALIDRMLAKRPKERPTMEQVDAELTQFLTAYVPQKKMWLAAVLGGAFAIVVVAFVGRSSLRASQETTIAAISSSPDSGRVGSAPRETSDAGTKEAGNPREVRQHCTISTEPSGALVRNKSSGERLGNTPLANLDLRGTQLEIQLLLAGYKTRSVTLGGDNCNNPIPLQAEPVPPTPPAPPRPRPSAKPIGPKAKARTYVVEPID